MSAGGKRLTERRRAPRIDVEGRTATIGFSVKVRLLDLSVNGVQLGVADDDDVTVGTRAWLTAVLGTEPLSVSVEVCRAVLDGSDDDGGGPAIAGELRSGSVDRVAIARFVTRAN